MRHDPALRDELRSLLPADADIVAHAPGRANLIGEHTDYNDGFVLPAALELRTVVAGDRADHVRLRSIGRGRAIEVDPADGSGPTRGWGRYVTAVVRTLLEDGRRIRGLDGIIASNLPSGTGLSSSAALEVAVALALLDEPIEPVALARLCQRAENVHVGVRSGIMDQLAAVAAASGSALLIDCRTLETTDVAIPDDLRLLVVDSGQRRSLARGDYNRRREECEEAARLLGVASLRDATAELVDATDLPEPLAARARHVVTENRRVLDTVDALGRDDRPRLGELFAASHASLATDFAVSTPALDALVDIAGGTDGVIAARMTGAGFGGCTVNLVEAERAAAALAAITSAYQAQTGRRARGWISAPSAGALGAAEPTMPA
ncbi:MAG: galactokinase [Chloroflexota bacterium]|nr:galactokinase [Chloroflexota bacterium]